MKTCSVEVVSVEYTCPYCQATIASPTGSLFWTRNETELYSPKPLTCFECGRECHLPVRFRR